MHCMAHHLSCLMPILSSRILALAFASSAAGISVYAKKEASLRGYAWTHHSTTLFHGRCTIEDFGHPDILVSRMPLLYTRAFHEACWSFGPSFCVAKYSAGTRRHLIFHFNFHLHVFTPLFPFQFIFPGCTHPPNIDIDTFEWRFRHTIFGCVGDHDELHWAPHIMHMKRILASQNHFLLSSWLLRFDHSKGFTSWSRR